MLSTTKKNNAASPENTRIIMVARTTSERVGQTILNHSDRTPRIKSIIFFIYAPFFFIFLTFGVHPPHILWQGQKESNPHLRFWRPMFYHWTMPLYPRQTRAFLRIWFERTPNIPVKISTVYRKIKRKYYKYFVNIAQVFFWRFFPLTQMANFW